MTQQSLFEVPTSDGSRWIVPGKISYTPGVLSARRAAELLDEIRASSPWHQKNIRFGGQAVDLPRLVSWHGDPGVGYRYSGLTHEPSPWSAPLAEIRQLVELRCRHRHNGVLLNYYRGGNDSIGRHADTEKDLVPGVPIVGVSLGATRVMRFRPVGGAAKDEILLPLETGSMLTMLGDCQTTWTHEIRKEPAVSGERISLTFRSVRVS